MKCPKCKTDLVNQLHRDIEVDYCNGCKGMWLDFDELDQLEDTVFDQDDYKGTVIFSKTPTDYTCPHCNDKLRQFKYRLDDLVLEYCDNQHGFWLDEKEEERILEIMGKSIENLQRKFSAEDQWNNTLRKLKSKSFFSKITNLFK